jgi:hypothetical protein
MDPSLNRPRMTVNSHLASPLSRNFLIANADSLP